jgi:hypothetical protein
LLLWVVTFFIKVHPVLDELNADFCAAAALATLVADVPALRQAPLVNKNIPHAYRSLANLSGETLR